MSEAHHEVAGLGVGADVDGVVVQAGALESAKRRAELQAGGFGVNDDVLHELSHGIVGYLFNSKCLDGQLLTPIRGYPHRRAIHID
jgi:hypothetical protein